MGLQPPQASLIAPVIARMARLMSEMLLIIGEMPEAGVVRQWSAAECRLMAGILHCWNTYSGLNAHQTVRW